MRSTEHHLKKVPTEKIVVCARGTFQQIINKAVKAGWFPAPSANYSFSLVSFVKGPVCQIFKQSRVTAHFVFSLQSGGLL